ncbi:MULTISPECIES: acetyl-CoA carboxylase biotin carboxyl carrier protein subunit [Aequorivita]|uniref:Biotin/lipoyl-binding protein n=1 Tax=Aequorivita iocasae TaxID=2803865 RepID=A0ABX7DNR3_9FLAO|nr:MULTISPECIES: acetyl-CoA carboxylase biotin carboxyl carrier protein subunit [Aequorivita]QQX75755.1 biotin/lipoyl-binding protein [Aequorivita iocasae]UCA55214.1 acetyl-CoA carboxylase biotin carboxyl carrier protein subunit [Aequorivita sp. F7]
MESYRISVDENYEFQLSAKDIEKIDQAELSAQKIHLLHNNKSFAIELLKSDFVDKKYSVKINGNTYEVNIATPLDQLIKEMGLSLGNASVEDEIHAPMPGIILEVNVSKGDEVKKDDFLCVLEAMKMENTLTAPRDGVIKSVNIVKGETVDKGKLLIEFEKND